MISLVQCSGKQTTVLCCHVPRRNS